MRLLTVPLVVLAALSLAPTAPAAERDRLPAPWTVDAATTAQMRAPNSAPPGSNDFGCELSRRRPHPVVLVHGLGANRTVNWQTMSPLLANNGYCVFALTYGTRPEVRAPGYQPGGLVRMEQSARELKRFVARVLRRTGARKVDIVGHSEGSLMPNHYVKFLGGARKVDDYVGMTPLWDGTNLAGIGSIDRIGRALGLSPFAYAALGPFCASCNQFLKGSEFLQRMNRGGAAVPGVDYTMIMTRNDELVIPFSSGFLEGARNVVLQRQCALDQSEHLSVAFDPVVGGEILKALDPRGAPPVPCTTVLPFVGAPGYRG